MRFVSIDLETTGLLADRHQILEIGVVVADFETPLAQLPVWSCQIAHEEIHGHPYALAMNADLIASIAKPVAGVSYYPTCNEAYKALWLWLMSVGYVVDDSTGLISITVAGKNVAGFDLPFLRAGGNWDGYFKTGHRVFDPGSLYFQRGDSKIPDLATCLKRAGFTVGGGGVAHRGVMDAIDVVRCLRHKYGSVDTDGGGG